ncbi:MULTISPECIES: ABC transporter substrate-binding protein [Thiorhodovibrio]|uniref:ABC transporter substrate-binding protein n=1 Tax=Thiorhodovibrio TaxID=61593 RepID=UPI001A935115|nr:MULTISPECIES: ABC transporter substrate-binding protein [Thiorhodovibrio]WPL11256.1 Leucine-, isoleucine-, valine-, threonine-, and alanine-binding protein precursor [Thiorhodovibrio litoralis]
MIAVTVEPRCRRPCLGLLLFFIGLLLIGCGKVSENQRVARAALGEGPIQIALVWDSTREDDFIKGATLALERINAAGGILDRPLAFVDFDDAIVDGDGGSRGVEVGRSVRDNPDIVAVIGHSNTATAIAASIIYEQAGILFINPAVTDRSLTEHSFQYVFSTVPDNELIGAQIATQAFSLGYRRIGILNSRNDESFEIAKAFAKQAAALGLDIVSRQSFFDQRENFREIIAGFGYAGFDALFLAAGNANTEDIVKQGIEMNFRIPFLLGSMNDPLALHRELGEETPPLIIPILFNPYADNWRTRQFIRQFNERYDIDPDGWAAQGYDTVTMLAEAMKKAKSTVPFSVATIIRYTLSWQGITGRHSFDQDGSIYAKTLDFAHLEEGQIQFHSAEGGVHTYVPEPLEEGQIQSPSAEGNVPTDVSSPLVEGS